MAGSYLASKNRDDEVMVIIPQLERLGSLLPDKAQVLDLGCGAGIPATHWLAQRFVVTGVDVSASQLALAQKYTPWATYVKSDMASLDFPPGAFNAVVSFYAIVHLPREEQPGLVGKIYNWLKPGGAFLANWAIGEWEGSEQNWEGWGAPMWWSHYDSETNLAMLRDAGFTIMSAEVKITAGNEKWLWVLARKDSDVETEICGKAVPLPQG
jgi:SAM-dependent methyltransferase